VPDDRPLTLGIDARAAAEVPAGRGRVVRELLAALAGLPEAAGVRFRLYAREPWAGAPSDPALQWVPSSLPDPLWHLVTALRATRECDAFLSTNSYLTAWFTRVPTIVLVHDLVAFVDGASAQSRAARIERATIARAMRRAAGLQCVSEATRSDLIARFPRVAPRAFSVPLAADARFHAASPDPSILARHDLRPHRYVLAVGTLEPRKNLPRLISAWTRVDDGIRGDAVLALVGPRGWDDDATLASARAAGSVRLLGHVPDDDLPALYAGSACFAYPSLYEGFGLPVLEAMAAGSPVVTSSISSLPEVAGDAALLVDPRDEPAITRALERLLADPVLAQELCARGRARAAMFSWERFATETLRRLTCNARREPLIW
jgi:glycosyltransferase involved in cell wall biosynthesis